MSEMSYGAGSMGAVRPQADMKNIQSKKSPLQKLKDFDKVRAGLGKKPIFKAVSYTHLTLPTNA